MNNPYKNAQIMQGRQAMHIAQLDWSGPRSMKKAIKPGRLEKKLLNAMDHFFTVIILLSGEEANEAICIGHIL